MQLQIIALGVMRSPVLGEVPAMHIRDATVLDAGRGCVETPSLRLVGCAGANSHVTAADVIKLPVMSLAVWRAPRASAPSAS